MKIIRVVNFTALMICCSISYAQNYQLKAVPASDFDKIITPVKEALESEILEREITPFDKSQTFILKDRNERVGYLIPVKFNSKKYKNTICRLYFLRNTKLEYIDLFAEKNDQDDVVPNCIGIEAASIENVNPNRILYLAIVRYRLANTYASTSAIVSLEKAGWVFKSEAHINNCMEKYRPISNILELKMQLRGCK